MQNHVLPHKDLSQTLTIEDAYSVLESLGPMPAEALAAMIDYGLSDAEISGYFGLSENVIKTLRRHWQITGNA